MSCDENDSAKSTTKQTRDVIDPYTSYLIMITIHSLALFNIIKGNLGVLLGKEDSIITSFEITDLQYYYERLPQFTTVLPQYQPMGLYYTDATKDTAVEINNALNLPILVENYGDVKDVKIFLHHEEIKMMIENDEIETIALKSINNLKSNETVNEFKNNILNAITQLNLKLEHILNFETDDVKLQIELNNSISQICKKINNLKLQQGDDNETDLMVNELSLINYKLGNIDKLKTQVTNNINLISNKFSKPELRYK